MSITPTPPQQLAPRTLDPATLASARFNMIEQQIRPWDVHAQDVLELLNVVKRESYVPPSQASLAFVDMALPLGAGQHMLPPRVEARLLQALQVKSHEQVLEIGTGSGYMAALLAHKAHKVTSVEVNPSLREFAAANLQREGVANTTVVEGNGLANPPSGPWDVIVLSGAVATIPAGLLQQLKVGGRLAAIVGQLPIMQMQVVTRLSEADYQTRVEFETVADVLVGGAPVSTFKF
ncbi:protein-L-isoaspartate O-methyltransferase family protein [Parvibium lacunae]|uniref:Protein-L-isoaspartate O-methyltransferase n=1 Tax=Parvibium lacunae TaxID=1888893 RepID=A0A368L1N6_9BURK|nr:protein-L-isoaspartate O-methyltransferase [Parvibium lacunae]RCS57393.1 protein-L-isoaspartate O-methyltransferase [Parvibium lacunae]